MKKRFKNRPLSWSQLSSFHYNPEEWYKRYILNEKTPPTKEMLFGSKIGKLLETDPTYLPEVPRYDVMEKALNVSFNDINMIGYIDSYCSKTHHFYEYKTSKRPWTQEKANTHGQLQMYALMLYSIYKVVPEDLKITLIAMQTEEQGDFTMDFKKPMKIDTFEVSLTMNDILHFGIYINKTIEDMEEYINNK